MQICRITQMHRHHPHKQTHTHTHHLTVIFHVLIYHLVSRRKFPEGAVAVLLPDVLLAAYLLSSFSYDVQTRRLPYHDPKVTWKENMTPKI